MFGLSSTSFTAFPRSNHTAPLERANFVENVNSSNHQNPNCDLLSMQTDTQNSKHKIEHHVGEFGAGEAQTAGDSNSNCTDKCINNEDQNLQIETILGMDHEFREMHANSTFRKLILSDNSVTPNETSALIVAQDSSNQSQDSMPPREVYICKSTPKRKSKIDYTENGTSDYGDLNLQIVENEHSYAQIQKKKRRSNESASDEGDEEQFVLNKACSTKPKACFASHMIVI